MRSTKKIVAFPKQREERRKDELAFLPAALEIVETPPSPIGRAIAFTLIAVFSAALAWACIGAGDYARAAGAFTDAIRGAPAKLDNYLRLADPEDQREDQEGGCHRVREGDERGSEGEDAGGAHATCTSRNMPVSM